MVIYMIKLMVEAYGLVQHCNEDGKNNNNFSHDNLSCKPKVQYLFIEEGRKEERESWAPH